MAQGFLVVLEGRDKSPTEYFTRQNRVTPNRHSEEVVWADFGEAQRARNRAALQDTLNRRVVVRDA